jgi:hypothetical protein
LPVSVDVVEGVVVVAAVVDAFAWAFFMAL